MAGLVHSRIVSLMASTATVGSVFPVYTRYTYRSVPDMKWGPDIDSRRGSHELLGCEAPAVLRHTAILRKRSSHSA